MFIKKKKTFSKSIWKKLFERITSSHNLFFLLLPYNTYTFFSLQMCDANVSINFIFVGARMIRKKIVQTTKRKKKKRMEENRVKISAATSHFQQDWGGSERARKINDRRINNEMIQTFFVLKSQSIYFYRCRPYVQRVLVLTFIFTSSLFFFIDDSGGTAFLIWPIAMGCSVNLVYFWHFAKVKPSVVNPWDQTALKTLLLNK